MWESSLEPREVNKNSSWLVRDWRQALAVRAPARKQRDPSAGPTAASANAGTTRAGGSAPGSATGTPGTRPTRRRTPCPSYARGAGAEAGRHQLIGGWQLRKVCKEALPPRELGALLGDLRGSSWSPQIRASGVDAVSLGRRRKLHFSAARPGPGWDAERKEVRAGGLNPRRGPGSRARKKHGPRLSRAGRATLPARWGARRMPGRPGQAEKVPARHWGPGPGSHPGPEPGSRKHTKDA